MLEKLPLAKNRNFPSMYIEGSTRKLPLARGGHFRGDDFLVSPGGSRHPLSASESCHSPTKPPEAFTNCKAPRAWTLSALGARQWSQRRVSVISGRLCGDPSQSGSRGGAKKPVQGSQNVSIEGRPPANCKFFSSQPLGLLTHSPDDARKRAPLRRHFLYFESGLALPTPHRSRRRTAVSSESGKLKSDEQL